MPVYEYRCQDCSVEIEVKQRITDDPLKTCEKCGGTLKRMISQTAFHLKGGGWYVTDYAGKGKKADKSTSKEVVTDKPAPKAN